MGLVPSHPGDYNQWHQQQLLIQNWYDRDVTITMTVMTTKGTIVITVAIAVSRLSTSADRSSQSLLLVKLTPLTVLLATCRSCITTVLSMEITTAKKQHLLPYVNLPFIASDHKASVRSQSQ